MIAKAHVFPSGKVHNQAKVLAVFGHMGNACSTAGLAVGLAPLKRQINAVQRDAARGLGNAAQGLQQFRLAVARHPCNAQNLSSADGQAHTFQTRNAVGLHRQVFHHQHITVGGSRALFNF